KSSSAPIGRKDSWCFHGVGSSNAPLLGSTAAEGLQRIGRTSIATRWRFCGLPQSASCSENFVIPPDVFGQTLRLVESRVDLVVELVDDLGRRGLRCAEAVPNTPLVARQETVHGRDVRQRVRARRGGYCERTQPASPEVFDHRGHGGERHLHLSTE